MGPWNESLDRAPDGQEQLVRICPQVLSSCCTSSNLQWPSIRGARELSAHLEERRRRVRKFALYQVSHSGAP